MKSYWCIALFILLSIFGDVLGAPPDTLAVLVKGTGSDARFEPVILQVEPGDVIRFEVIEGLHTVTAYHPENRRPLRIPNGVSSFNSGMLKTGDIWFLSLNEDGVYDYFCLPHERMGHAGRILVGTKNVSPDYEDKLLLAAVSKILNEAYQQFKNQNE